MKQPFSLLQYVAVVALAVSPLRSVAQQHQSLQSSLDVPPEAAVRGSTLMSDGRWLILGNEGAPGGAGLASIWDPEVRRMMTIVPGPSYVRAGHTATALPDGNVLVWGGVDPTGRPVTIPELYHPENGTFEILPPSSLTFRTQHTATVLSDGSVLMVGGLDATGEMLESVELWDPRTALTDILQDEIVGGRRNHSALLLPNGTVLLWGGLNREGVPLQDGLVYDPDRRQVEPLLGYPRTVSQGLPQLMSSLPANGARDVPRDGFIGMRFSRPVDVMTLNGGRVALSGRGDVVATQIASAEQGMLIFITPKKSLSPNTTCTVAVSGLTDVKGRLLPLSVFSFRTGESDKVSLPQDSEIDRTTDSTNLAGHDGSESDSASVPPLRARTGVTALSGRVVLLSGKPIMGVTVELEGTSTRTDPSGRFLLAPVPSGHHELEIDGRSANSPGVTYGIFEAGVDLAPNVTNVLPYKIWMPKIDTAHSVTIPTYTTSEVVVTTPRIPGLELRIPAHTAIRDHDGQPVTNISITPIPVDRPPFPLPQGVEVPIYYTIQPGGAYLYTSQSAKASGARLVYPNYTHKPPRTRFNFWYYDPEEKGWHVYGKGTVVRDGSQVVPDRGVSIYEFTGAMISSGSPPDKEPSGADREDGDPVDLGSGLFILNKTDLLLPDVLPIALTRTYRPADAEVRSFGIGTTHLYEMFLWEPPSPTRYSEADLILPSGRRIHYVRTSPGTGFQDAEFEHTASPTIFYKSTMKWNGDGWDVKLKDGTTLIFGELTPLQSIRDRNGNTIKIQRTNGQTGSVRRVTSPNGRWIEFTYDSLDRVTQAKDIANRAVSYTYDGNGRLWKVADPAGGVTEYTYDASHRMLTIKDAKGLVFLTNQFDAGDRVTKQTQANGTTYQFAYALDATGKITQTDVTDPRGTVRRVTFNAAGFSPSDTYAFGKALNQVFSYELQPATNLILSITDGLGRKSAFQYDSMGNITRVTRLAGTAQQVATTFTYDSKFNQLTGITDPLGHSTFFMYDDSGNLTNITDPLAKKTTLTYNAAGQPLSVSDPLGHRIRFEYDTGDLVSSTDALGNKSSWFVDGFGRVASMRDASGSLTRYEYNALNRLTKLIDPFGGTTTFGYDENGNLLSVTDARGKTTVYTYDNMDRLVTRKDPLFRVERFGYNPSGSLSRFTDRKGQVTTFLYDPLERRTKATYADSSTISYSYDKGNRITSVTDSRGGTILLMYDKLDRVVQESNSRGTVSYGYDAAGRRKNMTILGQGGISYNYDDVNRLAQITQGSAAVSFVYDDAGRRTQMMLPNGVVVTSTYDDANQVIGVTYEKGQTGLGTVSYGYDAVGNRSSASGSWARTGLPGPVAATYNAANQQITFGTQSLTFDANGDLTSDGITSYAWDARRQLGSMTSATLTAGFQYDGLGRRSQRAVAGSVTDFLYDGVNIVQELSAGSPAANLLTGLRVDEVFDRTDAGGSRTLLSDAVGSTLAVTSDMGVVQTEYKYDPFGRTTISGAASANSVQFVGRENDDTGLYYYRARYYSPVLQRFISEDPIGFRGGDINVYAYANNNPTTNTDPLGLQIDADSPSSPSPLAPPLGARKDSGSTTGKQPPHPPKAPNCRSRGDGGTGEGLMRAAQALGGLAHAEFGEALIAVGVALLSGTSSTVPTILGPAIVTGAGGGIVLGTVSVVGGSILVIGGVAVAVDGLTHGGLGIIPPSC